jgi:hypothetical protein
MSNLLSIHNSKNQVGIGTNIINVSSDLTIKENTRRYIVCNTNNNSLAVHRTIELEAETTLSTVKTHSISSPKLLYIASNSIISSLSFSSSANTYLRVSNTGGLGLVDKTAPIVQSISATDGTYGFTSPNNIINITVNFNETVSITGTPSLTLSNGASASYISGDNSTSILFRYTIQQSNTDSSSLSVSGLSGTIKDLGDNPCTTISGTLGSVVVDTTIPTMTITSSTSGVSSGSTSSGTPVSLIFTSNESTTNFSISDITVSNGSLNSFSGSGTTYTATFTPTASGTCTITVNAGTYTDTAGNNNTAGSLSWTFVAPVNGNTSVDWTLVNTSSANPTSSSSSYGDPNYNDGATWIIGGYQGSGRSRWQSDWFYNTSHTTENKKSFNLFEHTSNANSVTSGYYTLSRVYERTGLDHYTGGSTNDPSHGLKLKFNTTVGGDSNTAGHPQSSWAGNGDPWGMLAKMGYETPSTGTYVKTFATRGGISSSAPSKIIMDFNKYIALTSFEWPSYQWYGYHRHTRLYYWNESLSTPAWTEIIHFYSAFWGAGTAFFRKNNTGSDHGGTKNYTTSPTDYNNGTNVAGGYSGSFNQNVPREPLIRLRFPTSLSASSAQIPSPPGDDNTTAHVKSFVRQAYYARYYKIEQYGTNSSSAGMAYYAKMKGIIPPQTALY